MIERFENLTAGVSQIYKDIQRIKKHRMNSMGLKGTHVMCIHYLHLHPGGMTAAELSRACREDKAGISRILSDLESHGFICYTTPPGTKKYRACAILTESGKEYAKKVDGLILNATLEGGRGITQEEREIFYRVLFLIAHNLERFCDQMEKEEPEVKG